MYLSKEGQDRWVMTKLNFKKNGYFVDIGATAGIKHNNSYVMEKHFGWTGICVEPNKYTFPALKENRTCICENICISNISGVVDYVERKVRNACSSIYSDECHEENIKMVKNGYPLVQKDCLTLNELLIKHNAPNFIDYLSLDTEGNEYNILSVLDFNTYKFGIITLEHNCTSTSALPHHAKKREMIKELLEKNGYIREVAKDYEDWYVHT